MSLTPYPTLRLQLTMPQALKLQFLPAIPGSNAAAAADRAEQAAQDAQNAANTAVAATANKVDRTGDTMTGFLTLNADPATNLQAATKQYVDSHSGSGVTDGDKGDITVSGSGAVWTIDPAAVTYAKIQNVSVTARFLGRITAGPGSTEELTGTQATTLLDVFTTTLKGLAPLSGGGTTNFLRADGTWAAPSGGGGAPVGAEYITSTADATLTAERVLTDSASITWDRTTAGQIKANTAAGGGNVSNSGTPALDQVGVWVTATTIKGIGGTANQVLRIGGAGTTPAFGAVDVSQAAAVTGRLQFANLTQGTARSVLGVTGNATADFASVQGATDQVLRVNGAGTALAFGAIDLSKTAAATGVLQAASHPALTGDVTNTSGTLATTIANNAVSYAKMQDVSAASKLVGRGSALGAGDPEEITLGTGLSMSGTTLSSTGGSGFSTIAVPPQKFTASGTFTPTAGMKYCIIECVGGGGGGGGIGTTAAYVGGAGGGGSGAYSRATVSAAAVGASQTVTIGAAGNAGAVGGNGGAGGATSVGVLCAANGGAGGIAIDTTGAGGVGGIVNASTFGDLQAAGNPGQSGSSNSPQTVGIQNGGNGGSSFFGGGGRGAAYVNASTSVAGGAASNYGSGGGGAMGAGQATGKTGGAGSAGFVIITEFI